MNHERACQQQAIVVHHSWQTGGSSRKAIILQQFRAAIKLEAKCHGKQPSLTCLLLGDEEDTVHKSSGAW
ncbi:hypothetical protein UPYG_G00076450 [Umbra pygmaea]|uniref:Uncharacterized protein n=1 Tax=Umbra pygmaea TaxID=75934 RepID=A0ABD0Y0A0_UMBPY